MATQTRAVPAFGKRIIDQGWIKGRESRRELAICPWRFSACMALLVGTAFLLLLEAIGLMGAGGAGLTGGPGAGIVSALGAPNLVAGLFVVVLAAYLAQSAVATFRLAADGQALATIDSGGIFVLSHHGEAEMAWEEVSRMDFFLGSMRLDRRPRAVPRPCTRAAFEKRRVRVPALLLSGGSRAVREAVAEIRPDVASRLFG